MNRIAIVLAVSLLIVLTAAHAGDLAFYGFGTTSNDWSSSDTDELSVAEDMVPGAGLKIPETSGFRTDRGQPARSFGIGLNDGADDLARAITDNIYIGFTIDIATNSLLTLTNISCVVSFGYYAGHYATVEVLSSMHGFTADNSLGSVTVGSGAWKPLSIPLTTNYTELKEPVEFRLYVHDTAGRSAHGAIIDNVHLQGRAYPYPGLVISIF